MMAGGKGMQGRETPCYGIRFAEHSHRSASEKVAFKSFEK